MPNKTITEEQAAEYEQLKAAHQRQKEDEPKIAEKMAAGLSREQAVQVIEFQRKTDEAIAAEKAAAEKAEKAKSK